MTDQLFEGPQLGRDEPRGLGTAMAGGKGKLNLDKVERRALDYYPTPPECTRALMLAERYRIKQHGRIVWECCGRGGAIASVLEGDGFNVIATDIVPDPLNYFTALDVLQAETALAPIVITNPPFALAAPIIQHLLGRLGVSYMALLLKQTFWQTDTERGRGRLGLFRAFPPARRWDLTFRPDFTGAAASTMACTWFVWDATAPRTHTPQWGLLGRDGPITGQKPDLFTQGE